MIKKSILSYIKIHTVSSMLPGANCTSCGASDCEEMARLIITRRADVSRCVMCDVNMIGRIQQYLSNG